MVARSKAKKGAATAVADVAVAVADVEATGDGPREPSVVKRGRQRAVKKEPKELKEGVDDTPPPQQVEVPSEKPSKVKGPKKTGKGSKITAAAEEDTKVPIKPIKDEVPSADEMVDVKPAIIPEKKTPIRKRKAESVEKAEEVEMVAKKAPKVTKTKGAKKQTVDSDGIPEDPSAGSVSIAVIPAAQTNGTKTPQKRRAQKVEKVEEAENDEEPEEEEVPTPAKKPLKSKQTKKETKEAKVAKPPKEPKKSAPKASKTSKKSQKKLVEEQPEEEEATEHDVLPEDEFVPEMEQQQQEEEKEIKEASKPKKVVKSKGSRKQVVPTADEQEKIQKQDGGITGNGAEVEPKEAENDSGLDGPVEEPPAKGKGRKQAAVKTEKAPAKTASKRARPGKKGAKDEGVPEAIEEDQKQLAAVNDKEVNVKNTERNDKIEDAAGVAEPSKRKMNGTGKPPSETTVAEPKVARGRKRVPPSNETETKEVKPGRGKKRAAQTAVDEAASAGDEDELDGAKMAKSEDGGLFNPTKTTYNSSDFSFEKEFNLKISSWNIAGLRAWLKKDGLAYLEHEQPDILCLQEIKCTPEQLPEAARIPGYHPYWLCPPGGHAGVAVYSKIMPINVEYGIGNADHDDSGRLITAEYEKFYLLCLYVPNSGRKLVNLDKRMQWEELFREYVQKLEKVKPVIIAGDMNCSHKEIDLANPKTNTKSAGFTPEERAAFTKLLSLGYVDTFRHFHPDEKGAYTYWTYLGKARSRNVGWRLDYFILSERIISKAVESTIRSQVLGSDHCPITLYLNI